MDGNLLGVALLSFYIDDTNSNIFFLGINSFGVGLGALFVYPQWV